MGDLGILEIPRITTSAMKQARIVISLVQVLEDTGQNLGFSIDPSAYKPAIQIKHSILVRQVDLLRTAIKDLILEGSCKEGR